jgi:uncharacterized membrane protein required for colicin V production
MEFAGLNFVAIIVATVASFAFGSVYYMSLAGKWLAALGKTEEQIRADGGMTPKIFIVTAVAQFVMAWVLAGIIGHLGTGQVTPLNGVISGAFVWFGFVVTTQAVNHGYQGQKKSLTVIDSAHWLGVLLLQGLIIGLFGI